MNIASPDLSAAGLAPVDALRYDSASDAPYEVGGIIRSMLPQGVRVLDVGCGSGALTIIANSGKKNRVVGLELDHDRATAASYRGITVYEEPLSDELLDRSGRFDMVVAADVLEHVADPAALLQLIIKALMPGGFLILSVPNVAHWSVRLALLRGRFDYEPVGIMDATHLRWFTAKTLRKLIEGAGLQILEMRATANLGLPAHGRGLMRFLRGKRFILPWLAKRFPTLFGVQLVMKARPLESVPIAHRF
jgi:methionine biosynthesis protein MetW